MNCMFEFLRQDAIMYGNYSREVAVLCYLPIVAFLFWERMSLCTRDVLF